VRSFLDDVQFEVSNRLTEMIRERQRGLRDDTAARVNELQRTYRELAAAAKDDASQVYDDQANRVTALRDEIASLEQLRRDLAVATNDEGSSS
jgi:phage host-nuclease inhibitor protein Gam